MNPPALTELLDHAEALIQAAIEEDVGPGDVTTDALVTSDQKATGRLVAKQRGEVAGLPIAERVFKALSSHVAFAPSVADGARVNADDEVAIVSGLARPILTGERIALNFLQRLSGIATLTAAFVKAVEGTGVEILDTRKTTPGWRTLEKYAVRMGGGVNHRMGLYDMALIKDNHLVLAKQDVAAAVHRVRREAPEVAIQVEVEDLVQLDEALEAGADLVLLDNFAVGQMRAAVEKAARWRKTHERAPQLEASGGVALETVRAIAETGVDRISVGALTHSAPALDISLDLL